MMERFLAGEDGDHISYLDIDNNERYDDLDLKYFVFFVYRFIVACLFVRLIVIPMAHSFVRTIIS